MKLLDNFFNIENISSAGDETCCRIRLNPQHVIYGAHFPGNPITPGVCIIQMVSEVLELITGSRLHLKHITNVKFLRTLSPDKDPYADMVFREIVDDNGITKVKVSVRNGEQQFSQLSMTYYDAKTK